MAVAHRIAPVLTIKDIKRFWAHVSFNHDGCCPWVMKPLASGYGQFTIADQFYRAHAIARYLATGEWPGNLLTCHSCDNPLCCRPSHLWLGTHADNHRDRNNKGRQAKGDNNGSRLHPECLARGDCNGSRRYPERLMRGESHHHAKLTSSQVQELRILKTAGHSAKKLAIKFGISSTHVHRLVRGELWGHI